MDSMLEAVRIDGQPEEAIWPYIASCFTDVAAWVPPPAPTLFRRANAAQAVSPEAVITALDADDPVLLTMTISHAFYYPDAEGVIASNEPVDPQRVHAVVAAGHGQVAGNTLILVRNSWGTGWGAAGYAWVGVEYMRPRLLQTAVMGPEV